METFNDEFISEMQWTILPLMEQIALFKCKVTDKDRGKSYFTKNNKSGISQKELETLGDQLLKLTLESLWVWSKWFPVDPDTVKLSAFRITIEKLYQQGVRFQKIQFFKTEDIQRHLPDTSVKYSIPYLSLRF